MTPGRGQLSPKGHEWQDLCIPNYNFAAYKTCKFGYCGFKEEDFPILRLWQITTSRGVGCTNPRGIVGRICKEGHSTLLHIKCKCSGPCGLEKIFFDCMAKVANELLGGALLGPRGMICMIYIKLHITMLHIKY